MVAWPIWTGAWAMFMLYSANVIKQMFIHIYVYIYAYRYVCVLRIDRLDEFC